GSAAASDSAAREEIDAPTPVAYLKSALNTSLNVPCVCARCCARNPMSTTRPLPNGTDTIAAFFAMSSSPLSQPLWRIPLSMYDTMVSTLALASVMSYAWQPRSQTTSASDGMPYASGLPLSTFTLKVDPGD